MSAPRKLCLCGKLINKKSMRCASCANRARFEKVRWDAAAEPKRRWCVQCDRAVTDGAILSCKSRLCPLDVAVAA